MGWSWRSSNILRKKMKELGLNVSSKYCIIFYESGVKMKERDTPFCTVRTAFFYNYWYYSWRNDIICSANSILCRFFWLPSSSHLQVVSQPNLMMSHALEKWDSPTFPVNGRMRQRDVVPIAAIITESVCPVVSRSKCHVVPVNSTLACAASHPDSGSMRGFRLNIELKHWKIIMLCYLLSVVIIKRMVCSTTYIINHVFRYACFP